MKVKAKTIRLRSVKRLESLSFPFKVKKQGTGSLSFELLSKNNLNFFKKQTNAWVKWSAKKYDVSYIQDSWKPYLKQCLSPKADQISALMEQKKLIIFARSSRGLEGFIKMNMYKDMPASLSFMALAPSNIRSINRMPRFPGLSKDLMRLSMIISLFNAKDKPNHMPAMDCVFVSYTGVGFARKIFGIKDEDMQKIGISINRTGLEAYLDGNMEKFRENYKVFASELIYSSLEIEKLLGEVGKVIRDHQKT